MSAAAAVAPARARAEPVEAAATSEAPLSRVAVEQPSAPAERILALQGTAGNAAVARMLAARATTPRVQRWPRVSSPGEPMEREADAMSARVVSTAPAEPAVAPVEDVPASGAVARAPAGDGAPPGDDGGEPPLPPEVQSALTNPGSGIPLDPDVRARVEPVLGARLDGVAVHEGPAANQAAAAIQARAFTFGTNIFLGSGESAGDVALMAHEATHVAQQQSLDVYRAPVARSIDTTWIPDLILDAFRAIPGYEALTYVVGEDLLSGASVDRSPERLASALFGLVPFGEQIAQALGEFRIVQQVVGVITSGLAEHNLTMARVGADLERVWDQIHVVEGLDYNVHIVESAIASLLADVVGFVRGLVDTVLQLIKEAVISLADGLLERPSVAPLWQLVIKVLHHDPLHDVPVQATTAEILADFLRLIGKEQALAQMTEHGALQRAADWLDVHLATFAALGGELGALFTDAWAAIQPANIATLASSLPALADRAVGLVQHVGAFADDVLVTAVAYIKDALLSWLSEHAHTMRGFRLVTVVIGKDPFTGVAVPRSAENLIGGFIALLPGGEQTYAQLAESGVIAQAAGRIEAAMTSLGISADMVEQTFRGIWDSLSLEDLAAPLAAFERILALFGDPISRLVSFVGTVIQVVVELILRLMQFPSELLESIISNAMAAADAIERDPIGFLTHMLEAVKTGVGAFLEHIVSHLAHGLVDWIFHGLSSLGITMPSDTSLQSIMQLVLQVSGVTIEHLWQKLGQRIGEDKVALIRGAIDHLTGAWQFIKDVQEQGLGAVWHYLSDRLSGLWDGILAAATQWIEGQIVTKAAEKLLSMLDPTGIMAIVNSFIAFFRAIQSAIQYLREILTIVNEYVTTLAQVAAGNIGPAAAKLEQGLTDSIPVAIGFLASQVGLDDVPEQIAQLIREGRLLIDQALDWLLDQAMTLGAAALEALGIGGSAEEPAAHPSAVNEPFTVEGQEHHIYTSPDGQLMVASENPEAVEGMPPLAALFAEWRRLYASPARTAAIASPEELQRQRVVVVERMITLIRLDPALVNHPSDPNQRPGPRLAFPELLAVYEREADLKMPSVVGDAIAHQDPDTPKRTELRSLEQEFEALRRRLQEEGRITGVLERKLTDAEEEEALRILRRARVLARIDFGTLRTAVWNRLRQDDDLLNLERLMREAADSRAGGVALQVRSQTSSGIRYRSLTIEHRVRLSDNPWLYNSPGNLIITDASQNQRDLEELRQQGGIWPAQRSVEDFVVRHGLNDQGINFSPIGDG